MNVKQKIQEPAEEMVFEFEEKKVRQRYADAERRAKEAGYRASERRK